MTASSRTLPHVGEWKVELRAGSLEELFTELARVIADAAGTPVTPPTPGAWERVEIDARDYTTLLVDWANELIGRSEVAGRVYKIVKDVSIERGAASSLRLGADVRGEPVDEWVSPLKAATYHGAIVERPGREWRAVVLFDV